MTSKPTIVDCFAGAGGLSLGFTQAGFEPIFAFDISEAAIRTYNRNLGRHGVAVDVRQLDAQAVWDFIGGRREVDVMAGGPPCQGFSVQRRGSNDDARNGLVSEYVRLVLEIRPKFFLMENVGGLLSVRGRDQLQNLRTKCEEAGYHIHIAKLNAFDFGIPQRRKRVFIIGELCDLLPRFSFPSPTSRLPGPATVREAIADLSGLNEADFPNHSADRLSPINLERIRSIKEGEGRDSLPEHLQLPCHSKGDGHRHLDVYGRMAWDSPSPTITARFDSFSRGRFGHPVLDRTITLREGARLQSFPDSFVFEGTKVEIASQIGNAVPPLLAKAIACGIKRCL